MTLSVLNIIDDGNITNPMVCSEELFKASMELAFILEKHAIEVFKKLQVIILKETNRYFMMPYRIISTARHTWLLHKKRTLEKRQQKNTSNNTKTRDF
jgi:hypothetical protein